jgi:radical SAM enzyme (TIGR01210 family)
VPEPVRFEILRQIRASGFEFFATESRAEFLTASKLAAARQIVGDHIEMEIGLGLESKNDWIRRNCINKYLSLERFLQAVEECHRHKASVYAHVLTKPPFVSELEAIDDAVETTVWAFEHGVDRVGLALMNIKPGTVTHWLAQRGMYRPPMLWTIVRVLLLLPAEWRSRVGLFGFNSSVDIEQPAANCPICNAHMRSLLQAFCYTRDVDFLYQAEEYPCGCKASWLEELRRSYPPLPQRVASRYEALGRNFLGDDWWEANQSLVLAELRGEDDVAWS